MKFMELPYRKLESVHAELVEGDLTGEVEVIKRGILTTKASIKQFLTLGLRDINPEKDFNSVINYSGPIRYNNVKLKFMEKTYLGDVMDTVVISDDCSLRGVCAISDLGDNTFECGITAVDFHEGFAPGG